MTLDNLNIQKTELPKKTSYLITQTLIALKKFVFHPNNYLSLWI